MKLCRTVKYFGDIDVAKLTWVLPRWVNNGYRGRRVLGEKTWCPKRFWFHKAFLCPEKAVRYACRYTDLRYLLSLPQNKGVKTEAEIETFKVPFYAIKNASASVVIYIYSDISFSSLCVASMPYNGPVIRTELNPMHFIQLLPLPSESMIWGLESLTRPFYCRSAQMKWPNSFLLFGMKHNHVAVMLSYTDGTTEAVLPFSTVVYEDVVHSNYYSARCRRRCAWCYLRHTWTAWSGCLLVVVTLSMLIPCS